MQLASEVTNKHSLLGDHALKPVESDANSKWSASELNCKSKYNCIYSRHTAGLFCSVEIGNALFPKHHIGYKAKQSSGRANETLNSLRGGAVSILLTIISPTHSTMLGTEQAIN